MTNLPEEFRAFLKTNYSFFLPEIESKLVSQDGAVKYRLLLEDGEIIESVLIPTEKKNTLCLSTQVGCARNCKFCATGKMFHLECSHHQARCRQSQRRHRTAYSLTLNKKTMKKNLLKIS